MGSDFSKGKSHKDAAKYGQIFLQTDRATYYGGETVTGRIFLNLFMPYPGKELFLKLKGKEAVHFVIQRQQQNIQNPNNNQPGNAQTIIIEDLFQEKNDVIKLTVPIYAWGALMPGQFVIPFSFMLPANLPSSFHQEGHRYLANISYRLEAILEPSVKHEPKLKYKQDFIVRTPVKNAAHSQATEINTQLTTCCCCSQGSNLLKVNFEKNFYAPGEIAQVIMQLDNTQSKIDNQQITFALKQRLILTASGRTHQREFTKVHRDVPGVRSGGANDSNLIAMNLPVFQGGDYQKIKSYNMTQYLISLQDNNGILNSATRSRFITSEYYLEVACPMSGCCANTPTVARPIEIYYPEFQLPQVPTPANWQPQVIDSVAVSFGQPMGAPVPQPNIGMNQGYQAPNMGYNDMNQGQNYNQNPGMNQGQFGGQPSGQYQGQGQGQDYNPNPGVNQGQYGGQPGENQGQGQYGDNYYKSYS